MSADDDRDLREIFSRARDEDRRRAADFQTLVAARRRPSERRVFRPATLGLIAASLMFVAVYATLRPRPSARRTAATVLVDPRSTSWESPTDFLLVTPADSLLRSMPTLRYLRPDLPSLTPTAPTSPARRAGRITS